ncbi:hypothetical protein [Streptomyces sp. NPDC053720]|uniref:hypothetical protein n=1 Tax=Streptomyces sp. NPDC053720 TaxID=3154855 RepID=UPI0034234E07
MCPRPPILIAAPGGPHPALDRVTADPRYGTPVAVVSARAFVRMLRGRNGRRRRGATRSR